MNNFKTIRSTYECTLEELSLTLELKSSIIAEIESGKMSPSSEILTKYADLFGVSTDWLLGRTVEPYTKASVLCAEESAYSIIKEYDIGKKFLASLPKTYLSETKRRKLYSLEMRANLAYIISTSYSRLMSNYDYSKSQENVEHKGILDTAYDYILDRRRIKYSESELGQRDRNAAKVFDLLVNRRQKDSIYSIESVGSSSDC